MGKRWDRTNQPSQPPRFNNAIFGFPVSYNQGTLHCKINPGRGTGNHRWTYYDQSCERCISQ